MKSESKKFEMSLKQAMELNKPKQQASLKSWLITYEIYRVTSSITQKVDIGTKVVEAESIGMAVETLRKENQKLVITYIYEL